MKGYYSPGTTWHVLYYLHIKYFIKYYYKYGTLNVYKITLKSLKYVHVITT